MITDKQKAIKEVLKMDVDLKEIDPKLLKDKEVVLNYIKAHSSNDLLNEHNEFISLDVQGIIDDECFITKVIENLQNGYNESDLNNLLKLSVKRIIYTKLDTGELKDKDAKKYALQLLKKYKNALIVRKMQLATISVNNTYNDVCEFVDKSNVLDEQPDFRTRTIFNNFNKILQIIINHLKLSEKELQKIDILNKEIEDVARKESHREEDFKNYVADRFDSKDKSEKLERYKKSAIGFTAKF